ncbi:sir2 family protein [Ophiostoma piceae UAMH 11346]|uniref:Sir2 family protein n=1 Tax=Ophiostoma piceae (strain UAMH 11346) TaxID=1262450 RepID=S3C8L2_OPHP1|nr:sir2 family protein [Ophiostoma piceae UAMH 11346]
MDEIIASPAMTPQLPSKSTFTPPRPHQSHSLDGTAPSSGISQPDEPLQRSSRDSTCSPPSSPLSEFAKTPSPPSSPALPPIKISAKADGLSIDPSKRYPSPSATSQSGAASPRKMDRDADNDHDGPPPAKKRRVQAPPRRPRMTRHLDLDEMDASEDCETELGYLLRALRTKKKIVVIAGAGISVSAGIPDFRSSTGLFTTLRGQHGLRGSGKHLFDASVYKHDSSTSSFHTMVRELAHMTQTAKPTAFHHMLASLAQEGRLMRLYSQNVDCIDTNIEPLATNVPLNAKGPWPTTIQLHGGLAKMVCSKCGQLEDFDGSLFEGPEPPPCVPCTTMDEVRTAVAGKRSHGIGRLRPRIVLYNEYNPDEEAIGNVSKADLRRGADAVIVVGTSLKIPGVRRLVKELCLSTRSRRDGFTAWINVDAEPQGAEFKDCWDLVVRGGSDDVARLVGLPHWDEPDVGSPSNWNVTGDEDFGLEKLEVVLDSSVSPSKKTSKEPTTSASKKPQPLAAKNKNAQKSKSLPTASIPTPSSSPKPQRKRLPDIRQSKLPFQQVKGANAKAEADGKTEKKPNAASSKPATSIRVKTETVPIKLGAATKKARSALPAAKSRKAVRSKVVKPKKEDKAASKNLALAFRATKNITATPDGKKRKPLPSSRSPDNGGEDNKGNKRTAHAMELAGDTSMVSDMSELSSPPDSVKRRLSTSELSYLKLPTLRDSPNYAGNNSSPRGFFGGKENTAAGDSLRRALDVKMRQPSSLSRESLASGSHEAPETTEKRRESHEHTEPHTPATHSRRASDAETISPQSVPRGMGILIN